MPITDDQVQEFASAIANLHEGILLGEIADEPGYLGYIDRDTPFALDIQGYTVSYLGLLRRVFQLPRITETWSEDGVQELGHELISMLAHKKKLGEQDLDFTAIARDWLSKIDLKLEEFTCYAAVAGLSVDKPLQVGEVSFLPLDDNRPEFDDSLARYFIEKLNSFRDSLSCSKITAEWRRASEIHREKTERALNVLRFIGSLIWHDQPTRHANIASLDPRRISDSLVVSSEGLISRVGGSRFTPLPLTFDRETIQYANFYGLQEIQHLLSSSSISELQQSFLTAIQWFGQATQELLPLVGFVKYYISIEAALKRPGENAKTVLPRRLGVLLVPWNKSRLARLEADLLGFIDERNAVFHSGAPLSSTAERLEWDSRILARQALHQLRLRLKSEQWQTKDDLIAWVDDQYRKYLS
jgi:hypothetical protein